MLLFYFWPKMNIWRKLLVKPRSIDPKNSLIPKSYITQKTTAVSDCGRGGQRSTAEENPPSSLTLHTVESWTYGRSGLETPRTASTPGAENRHTLLQPLTLLEAAVPAPARLITGPCLSTGHSLLPTLFYDLCGLSARGLGCHYAVQCLGLLACDLVQRRRL